VEPAKGTIVKTFMDALVLPAGAKVSSLITDHLLLAGSGFNALAQKV